MGITLIVTRSYDRNVNDFGLAITLEEWTRLVEGDSSLRFQQKPYTIRSPSGDQISIPVAPGEAEFKVGGSFVPFLSLRSGELVMPYREELEEPENPVRQKIGEIARRLQAIIKHDAGDEILSW